MAIIGDGFHIDEQGNATIYAVPAVEITHHHCPFCQELFTWTAFIEHARGCIDAHPEQVAAVEARIAARKGSPGDAESQP